MYTKIKEKLKINMIMIWMDGYNNYKYDDVEKD